MYATLMCRAWVANINPRPEPRCYLSLMEFVIRDLLALGHARDESRVTIYSMSFGRTGLTLGQARNAADPGSQVRRGSIAAGQEKKASW